MASINPSTSGTYWNGRSHDRVFLDPVNASPIASPKLLPLAGLRLRTFYFTDADASEDWPVPRGVVAVAWQSDNYPSTGVACPTLVTTATLTSVRFSTGSSNANGWMHCLIGRSSIRLTDTVTDISPVAKGTAGYVQPGFIWANVHNESFVPTETTRPLNAAGLKMQVYPFNLVDATDTWTCNSQRKCPGIVAIAWQASEPGGVAADRVIAALDSAGDVQFTSGGGGNGWLWVWRKYG